MQWERVAMGERGLAQERGVVLGRGQHVLLDQSPRLESCSRGSSGPAKASATRT